MTKFDIPFSNLVKDINELTEETKHLLYSLRLSCDRNVPIDTYINYYKFVVIDDIVYCADDDYSKKMLNEYLRDNSTRLKRITIPHAIILNGTVIKNRYGCNSK